MLSPLEQWNNQRITNPQTVWFTRLDGRYLIEVQRVMDYRGALCIFDHENGDNLIHQEEVVLSYGAIFGPDVADVATWQERCLAVVDNLQSHPNT